MKMTTFWEKCKEYVSNIRSSLTDSIVNILERNRINPKESYYNNKYPKSDIVYNGRILPNSLDRIPIDVRDFFTPYNSIVRKIVESLNLEDKTDDEKALICLSYILDNYKYVLDKTKGHLEYWQFPHESVHYKTMDCEDGAILLANMLLISGVDYWKIRITAGNVNDNKGTRGGHCFLVYYCEEKDEWILLDWCYWPNKLPIKNRKKYADETYYKNTWFSWNQKYCYAKDLKDIPKMENIKSGS